MLSPRAPRRCEEALYHAALFSSLWVAPYSRAALAFFRLVSVTDKSVKRLPASPLFAAGAAVRHRQGKRAACVSAGFAADRKKQKRQFYCNLVKSERCALQAPKRSSNFVKKSQLFCSTGSLQHAPPTLLAFYALGPPLGLIVAFEGRRTGARRRPQCRTPRCEPLLRVPTTRAQDSCGPDPEPHRCGWA